LPRNTCLKVSGKKKETWMRWVSELMKQNTRVRDEEKIRKYFFPHDADAIAAINLTQRHTEDFVAWIMEENGIFTVRSAYRLGMQPSLDSMAPGAQVKRAQLLWVTDKSGTVFGRLKCHKRFIFFGWKAATNTLAVCGSLHQHIRKFDPICPICRTYSSIGSVSCPCKG
jgi:hypothetical protein